MKWRRIRAGSYLGQGDGRAWHVYREDATWRLRGFDPFGYLGDVVHYGTFRAAQAEAERREGER